MIIEPEIKLDFKDVLIRPKRSTLTTRKEVDLSRKFSFVNAKLDIPYKGHELIPEYSGIPIMASNMDGVGTMESADALIPHGMFTCLTKTYSEKQLEEFFVSEENKGGRSDYVAMSIGITEEDKSKFNEVYKRVGQKLRYVCIDVANGYTERFCNFIANFRDSFPNIIIIAGNVCTADQTQELILKGADIIKCGIGPGSVCTTRVKTGVGYPQLSTIIECSDRSVSTANTELFGPILSVIKFKTEEEALKIANDNDYGLSSGVFSEDPEKCDRVSKELDAGICFKNCYRFISYAASFGGRKNSGYGRESGADAIADMQIKKTIWTSNSRVTEDPFKIR